MKLITILKTKIKTALATKKQQVKTAGYAFVGLFIVAVSFQNCGGGFKAISEEVTELGSEADPSRRSLGTESGGSSGSSSSGGASGSSGGFTTGCGAGTANNYNWGSNGACTGIYPHLDPQQTWTITDSTTPATGQVTIRCVGTNNIQVEGSVICNGTSSGGTSGGTTGNSSGSSTSGGNTGGTTSSATGGTSGGTTGSSSGGNSCAMPTGGLSITDPTSGAVCRLGSIGIESMPDNNSSRGFSYSALGSASTDAKAGYGRICAKCVNNVLTLSTNPDSDCAAYTNDRRHYCNISTCTVSANYAWGGCRASNSARTLNFGETMDLTNVSDAANSGSATLKCDKAGANQQVTLMSGSTCDLKPVYVFNSLYVEYGAGATAKTVNYNRGYSVLESNKKTFHVVNNVATTKEASYEDITGNVWITSDQTYPVEVSKVTISECNQANPTDCRSEEIDPNKIGFESIDGADGAWIYKDNNGVGMMFVCFNLGNSAEERRGAGSCYNPYTGQNLSASIFWVANKDQTQFRPEDNMPKRGTMMIGNSRTWAKGQIKVRATILPTTPKYGEKYAGRSGDVWIEIVNRPDIRIIPNTKVFDISTAPALIEINSIGEENSLNSNATFQTKSCTAVAKKPDGTTVTIPGEFDPPSTGSPNRYRMTKATVQGLPKDSEIEINCSAKMYNTTETATAVYREKKEY